MNTAENLPSRLSAIALRMASLSREVAAFWLKHGPDTQHGGFLGSLDRNGAATEPTDKGLIQQARHLWTWSMWYQEREPTARIRAVADSTFDFLDKHFRTGGSDEFAYRVSADGTLLDAKQVLYAQSFAIYGLTEYARVFHVAEAQEMALACFRAIDRRAHDAEFLGYDQVNDAPWLAPDTRKETNTHLHLLEAFTTLYELTADATVGARLEELLTLFVHRIVQPAGYLHLEFSREWQPLGAPAVSYGHDLETAWLMLEAARVLRRPNDGQVLRAVLTIANNSANSGFDTTAGGYFEEGIPGGGPTKLEKIWWIQAEALPGLFRWFEHNGDLSSLTYIEKTLSFIESKQRHRGVGEWFWGIAPDGSVGPRGERLGEEWKTGYHNLRALVFTENWIRSFLHAS